MTSPAILLAILATVLLAASAALAQPATFAERYSPVPASTDGIGKRYVGREISAVMGWQGAGWLERADQARGSDLRTGLGAHH